MDARHAHDPALRPAVVCQQLLQASDASEGRRKRRKRNTTPDSLGMEVKRVLAGSGRRRRSGPGRLRGGGSSGACRRPVRWPARLAPWRSRCGTNGSLPWLPAASAPGWPPALRATTHGQVQTWGWIRGSEGGAASCLRAAAARPEGGRRRTRRRPSVSLIPRERSDPPSPPEPKATPPHYRLPNVVVQYQPYLERLS